MAEVHRRLVETDFSRRFAASRFDDGYRDNRDFALPVLREFDAPVTVYVASDFAEGIGRLWWISLEMAIAKACDRGRRSRRGRPFRYRARRQPSRPHSTGCMIGCAVAWRGRFAA